MTTVNLQDAFKQYQKEDEVTVLEEGEYTLEVIRCAVRGQDKNALMPVYRVIGGPYAGKTVMAGQLTLTENSKSIFFRNLKGFGVDENFIMQAAGGLKDIADALVGRVVKMKVQKRQWQGNDRNQFPIGGVMLVSLPSQPGAPQVAAQQAAPVAPQVAAPVQQVPQQVPPAQPAAAVPAAPVQQVPPPAPAAVEQVPAQVQQAAPAAQVPPPAAAVVTDPAATPPPPPPPPAGTAPQGTPF